MTINILVAVGYLIGGCITLRATYIHLVDRMGEAPKDARIWAAAAGILWWVLVPFAAICWLAYLLAGRLLFAPTPGQRRKEEKAPHERR